MVSPENIRTSALQAIFRSICKYANRDIYPITIDEKRGHEFKRDQGLEEGGRLDFCSTISKEGDRHGRLPPWVNILKCKETRLINLRSHMLHRASQCS